MKVGRILALTQRNVVTITRVADAARTIGDEAILHGLGPSLLEKPNDNDASTANTSYGALPINFPKSERETYRSFCLSFLKAWHPGPWFWKRAAVALGVAERSVKEWTYGRRGRLMSIHILRSMVDRSDARRDQLRAAADRDIKRRLDRLAADQLEFDRQIEIARTWLANPPAGHHAPRPRGRVQGKRAPKAEPAADSWIKPE